MPEADIKSALARVRAARALDPDAPAALPSVSVGPSEYSEHMAVAGPLAEAKHDLDGLPAIPESGTSGYVIRGRVVSNSEVKRYIIEQIAAGLPLPVIVDAAKSARFPSLFTVRKWLRQDDKFAEAYMGRTGKRIGEIPDMKNPKSEIRQTLKAHREVIEEMRDFVGEDSTLQNIVDEIVGLYLSTEYMLTLK